MGGGDSGGSVVSYTPPSVAAAAGQISKNAATEASQLASKSINDAINAINKQYSEARYAVQPYQQTGIQALDQLNQYLGLDAYNPGTAPVTPKSYEEMAKAASTPLAIRQYINQNTQFGLQGSGAEGSGTGNWPEWNQYTGVGSNPNGQEWDRPMNQGVDQFKGMSGNIFKGNIGYIYNNPEIRNAISEQLTSDWMADPTNKDAYDQKVLDYQRNLQNYNQNLDWYNKYSAEGPFTSQQVQDKISNLPGYQAQLGQGSAAIGANASAKGYLGSGRLLKELNMFGQNTLATFYGNELNRLSGLVTQGANAAAGQASSFMNQGNAQAQAYNNLGEIQANASLAAGNAQAQALMAGGQQFKTVGGGGGGGSGIGSAIGTIGSLVSSFL